MYVDSSWNVTAHGEAREGEVKGETGWMQWVASTLHTTSEHGVSRITTADAHNSVANSRLNWRPLADLNGLVRFAERRNLVSARVPSYISWPLRMFVIHTPKQNIFAYHVGEHNLSMYGWPCIVIQCG